MSTSPLCADFFLWSSLPESIIFYLFAFEYETFKLKFKEDGFCFDVEDGFFEDSIFWWKCIVDDKDSLELNIS